MKLEDWAIPATPPSSRIDTAALLARVDLAAVATGLMGPPEGRRGARGSRLYWRCRFHPDKNPSLCVDPARPWWKCYGCGERGTAIDLMMRLGRHDFLDACRRLAEDARLDPGSIGLRPLGVADRERRPPHSSARMDGAPRVAAVPSPHFSPSSSATTTDHAVPSDSVPHGPGRPAEEPAMLTASQAGRMVEHAAELLWGPEGGPTLRMLRARGLGDDTIRSARLGYTGPLRVRGHPGGLVIPWFDRGRLRLAKLRPPDGGRGPKYREVFRDRPTHYLAAPIRPGRPLIVVEGEVDAITVAQEAGEWAAVVTLGSASGPITTEVLAELLAASPWLIATDADDAGDRAAEGWRARAPGRFVRLRPPEGVKDWNELHVLSPGAVRCTFAREGGGPAALRSVLAAQRWGEPSDEDEPPGLLASEPPPTVPPGWSMERYLDYLRAGGTPGAAGGDEA